MEWICFIVGLLVGGAGTIYYYLKFKGKARNHLNETDHLIIQLVENSKDIIYRYEVKPTNRHTYISPSVEHFLGEGKVEAFYKDPNLPFELIHPDDVDILNQKMTGEVDFSKGIIQRLQDSQGNYRWFEEHATPIYKDGQYVAIQGVMRNIDEKIRLEQELQYKVNHDSLTGIFNRAYFECMMELYNEMEQASIALILCDLDELKFVNDHYGHREGDELIKGAAQILDGYFVNEAIVSRVGGDEFAIIIPNTSYEQVEDLCNKLTEQIVAFNAQQDRLTVKMSIGLAYNETSIGEMDRLYVEADQKMYAQKRAKKQQKGQLVNS